MTLIAGIKCRDGFVLSADSQETVGPYRVNVKKLIPRQCGNFELAVAGAGNNGTLIDAFEQQLIDNISANNLLRTIPDLKKFISAEIRDFQKNEATNYSRKDRDMQFLIGARSIDPPACEVWETASSRLREVRETPTLIGFDDERYKYLLENLNRNDLTIAQGIFISLHLMAVAEQTSHYIKAPVSIVFLKDGAMRQESQAAINAMLQRVKLFEAQFDNLFLACPDTGLQPSEFAEKFKEFVRTVVQLRQEYFEESIREKVAQGLQVNDIYNLIPAGTTIAFQATALEQAAMQRTQEEMVKGLREDHADKQEYSRILSNLAAMEKCHTEHLEHLQQAASAPNDEARLAALTASGEILQAALMGPYKITDKAVLFLNRVRNFEITDLGFGQVINLQLLVMAIKQAIEFIREESASDSARVPPSPAQS